MPRIDQFLEYGRKLGGSDIHFTVGLAPLVRVDGDLAPIEHAAMAAAEIEALAGEILSEYHAAIFAERGSVDLAHHAEGVGRFRVNICRHRRGVAVICRVVAEEVPALAGLGLPRVIGDLTKVASGLVLVTGATGTGKSTTLAAMIQEINRSESVNIITLEDPVEYVHVSDKALVIQRELGTHVRSFKDGLRSALRQDPDVIMVGEIRDAETVTLALEAAETGHLVFGTLHTRGAAQTIDRIIDAHPSDDQSRVRYALADNLKAVVTQDLVRAADGRGRRPATEVLMVTPAVSQMIREGKTFQIPDMITTGRRLGMQLMDQSLFALVRAGDIDPDEAFLRAEDKTDFIPFVTKPELLAMVRAPERAAA
jgi:twitching motility protein PilT